VQNCSVSFLCVLHIGALLARPRSRGELHAPQVLSSALARGDASRTKTEVSVVRCLLRSIPRRCRLTRRCSEPHHHKVLGRGRPSEERGLAPRARVLKRTRAVAELSS